MSKTAVSAGEVSYASAPLLQHPVEARDPEAVDFLKNSGLPLSAVILAFFDQSDDCIKLLDPAGRLRFMNCNGKQAMEIDDFAVVEGCFWDTLWPEDSRGLVNGAVAEAKNGKLSRFEAFCPTGKGTPKWWEVTVSPIWDGNGAVAGILSSSRDVTDRRSKAEALATIAAEMKHRLRNAYTVGAAVSLTMAKDHPQHQDFAREVASRLMGLAEVQGALVDAKDIGLREIVEKITHAYDSNSEIVSIGDVPAVRLDEQRAKALVLVLGELATNSLKHGAMSGRGSVSIKGAFDGRKLVIEWLEHHDPTAAEVPLLKVPGGSGQELMRRMLATIGGSITTSQSHTGYSATVTIEF